MSVRVFLLLAITAMVMAEDNTSALQEKAGYEGFWNTMANFALSEDSFKSWFLNMLEWVVFLVAETMFKLYF